MNSLLDSDRDEDIEDTHSRGSYGKDREITLGTTMVLGIFFALAVFGAVFFGFGYSMGAKHAAANTAVAGEPSSLPFNSFKPAPGNPLGAPAAGLKPGAVDPVATPLAAVVPPRAAATPKATTEAFTASTPVDDSVAPTRPAAVKPAAVAAGTPASPAATPVAAGVGSSMVQVAAVSHQEDADLLVTTLKRRGYAVAIHSEPQDKLLHVQIGPFSSKADANSMRQKLLADGFNAIVK